MKVRFDSGARREVELDSLSWPVLNWVDLPDLSSVDDSSLRCAHDHVMRQVFEANGPVKIGISIRVLRPIEQEMRRRGMQADYWSMEHTLRSNLAFVLKVLEGACAQAHPDYAERLRRQAEEIRAELRQMHDEQEQGGGRASRSRRRATASYSLSPPPASPGSRASRCRG